MPTTQCWCAFPKPHLPMPTAQLSLGGHDLRSSATNRSDVWDLPNPTLFGRSWSGTSSTHGHVIHSLPVGRVHGILHATRAG